jgi:signal peptidase
MLRLFPQRAGRAAVVPAAGEAAEVENPAETGIEAVLAAEARLAAHRDAALATAPAEPEPEPERAPRRTRSLLKTLRELTRAIATAYVSAYVSLVIWSMLPMVFGWTPTVVISGSMTPVIKVGDVVFFAPEDPKTLAPGRVILVDDPDVPGRLLSHRLYERKADGTLVTKGDANPNPDPQPVTPDRVRGAARLVIPLVGKVTLWRGGNRPQAILWTSVTAAALIMARSPGRLTDEPAAAPAARGGRHRRSRSGARGKGR